MVVVHPGKFNPQFLQFVVDGLLLGDALVGGKMCIRDRYTEGEDIPYTDMDVFPGCPLWIAGEGWDGPVYLQTPEGTYLECIKG